MTEPQRPAAPISTVVARAKTEQEVCAQIERMPALPAVVVEVLRLANDPASTAKDLQGILRQDQVLIGRILKLVNSSFYARARRIGNIQEAIVLLGYDTIKNVVVAASASKLLHARMEAYGYAELGLWKHSLACAVTSKQLAGAAGLDRELAGETFLCGLLHDIGKIVLDGFLRAQAAAFRALLADGTLDGPAAERRILGIDHAQVGVRIAKRWNFPPQVEEVIRTHHDLPPASPYARHAAVAHLADAFMNAAGIGLLPASTGSHAATEPKPSPQALVALGLGVADLPRLREAALRELDAIRALCDSLAP